MKFPKKSKKGNFQENEKKILIALKGKIHIPPKNFTKNYFKPLKKREKKNQSKNSKIYTIQRIQFPPPSFFEIPNDLKYKKI